jgi:hypothetical protein
MDVIRDHRGIIRINGTDINNRQVVIENSVGELTTVQPICRRSREHDEVDKVKYFVNVQWRGFNLPLVLTQQMIVGFHNEIDDMDLFNLSACPLVFHRHSNEFTLDGKALHNGVKIAVEFGDRALIAIVKLVISGPTHGSYPNIHLTAECIEGRTMDLFPQEGSWVGTRMHIMDID